MQIILPDSKEIIRHSGHGGYGGEYLKIPIHKMVDIFGFYTLKIPKGKISEEHFHEHFIELFYFLSPARFKINDSFFTVPKLTMVVIHPGDRHEIYAEKADVDFLVFKFPFVEGDKVLTRGKTAVMVGKDNFK
jgi:hypothetical protein